MPHIKSGQTEDNAKRGSENCLPVGTMLAEFELVSVIGEGGFGIVYLAFDRSLQRTVAIKEYMPVALAKRAAGHALAMQLPRHQEAFGKGLKSFINEARLLAQFDHPALIKVYRFWEENHTGYMAMQYYQGETLKSMVQQHPQMVTQAWLEHMLRPLLEALEVLYRVHILHRDISPDNIMIQHSGDAVLLDFGAARQNINDMSSAVTVILKPGYAPIEQYMSDASMAQGPWTDIYSLSAVVYFAITKKPAPASVARIINDMIEPLQSEQYPEYTKQFLAAINHGLALKPEGRPASIAHFCQLLGLRREAVAPLPAVLSGALMSLATSSVPVAKASLNAMPALVPRIVPERRAVTALAEVADSADSANGPNGPVVLNPGPADRVAAQLIQRKSGLWLFWSGLILIGMIGTAGYILTRKDPLAAVSAPVSAPVAVRAQAVDRNSPYPDAEHSTDKEMTEEILASPASVASPMPAAVAAVAAIAPTATLRLNIKPWAEVSLDGVPQGVSPPLKKLVLSVGKHTLGLVNPSFPTHRVELIVTKKGRSVEYDFSQNKK